jgi:hypothetical protein
MTKARKLRRSIFGLIILTQRFYRAFEFLICVGPADVENTFMAGEKIAL